MNDVNIVLIGIMGCGKTTVGRDVADRLKLRFIDLDEYIEGKWGSIPSLFEKGEAYFRQIESLAVIEVCEMDGVVIATGGGVVLRSENVSALKHKGIVFFLDRPLKDILADIDTSHRPLLKEGKSRLETLYRERYPIYLKACDVHIRGAKKIEDSVGMIIRHIRYRS